MKMNTASQQVRLLFTSVLLTLCLISCDDWLKPEPLSFYSPENTYITKEGLEAALISCRAMIRPEFLGNNSYACTELMTSDIAVAGNIVAQTLKNFEIQLKPGAYGDSQIGTFWTKGFSAIQKANTVISRSQMATLTDEDKNMILAEGYFHRSYWYYKLADGTWGRV